MKVHLRKKVPAFRDSATYNWHVPTRDGSFEILLSADLFEKKYKVHSDHNDCCFCSEVLMASLQDDGKYRVSDFDGNVNVYNAEDFSVLFAVDDRSSPIQEHLLSPTKSMKCIRRSVLNEMSIHPI